MALVVDEQLSKRIHSLRFLLIIFVVFIHNVITEIQFQGNTEILQIPVYVDIVRNLISQIIARVAVPMFFIFSGYLLYLKESSFKTILKKKSRSILLPYFLWTILYMGWALIIQNNPFRISFASPEQRLLNWNWIQWVQAFIGGPSRETGILGLIRAPYVVPLWFLRDLFVLSLLFIVIKKLVDKLPFAVLTVTFILWISETQLYIVSPEALIFFIFGYYAVKYNLNIGHLDKIRLAELSAVYIITIGMELFGDSHFPIIHKLNIIIGIVFFFKVSYYFIRNDKVYKCLLWLEGYEFFVYAFHAFVLGYVLKITCMIIPLEGGFILLQYFSGVIISTALCIVCGAILKTILPIYVWHINWKQGVKK
jgi:surface polysaccharide O-acyltransferase-like enzyme